MQADERREWEEIANPPWMADYLEADQLKSCGLQPVPGILQKLEDAVKATSALS